MSDLKAKMHQNRFLLGFRLQLCKKGKAIDIATTVYDYVLLCPPPPNVYGGIMQCCDPSVCRCFMSPGQNGALRHMVTIEH